MTGDLIEAVRRALENRRDVRLAFVFGSTARHVAGPDSDVDLAVQGRGLDPLALARDVSAAIGRDVQVVDLAAADYPLLAAIVRDGIVVAEHERGAEARWRAHALLAIDVDRPWWERMRDAYLASLDGAR